MATTWFSIVPRYPGPILAQKFYTPPITPDAPSLALENANFADNAQVQATNAIATTPSMGGALPLIVSNVDGSY